MAMDDETDHEEFLARQAIEDAERMDLRKAACASFLESLADHVERPSPETDLTLRAAAASYVETTDRIPCALSRIAGLVFPFATELVRGDPGSWGQLLNATVGTFPVPNAAHGDRLRTRLRDLSPAKGRLVVYVQAYDAESRPRHYGDTDALLKAVLAGSERRTLANGEVMIVIDPASLVGAVGT